MSKPAAGSDLTIAIHQPNYLPYLGYLHKMAHADTFLFYDTAQYSKNSLSNRNRIKTATGVQWLTVPVRHHGVQRVQDVEIATQVSWQDRHKKAIEANYRRAPYFDVYAEELFRTISRSRSRLADLNMALVGQIARWLAIDTRLVRASSLHEPPTQDPTEKLIFLTKECGGSVYLSGPGGTEYLCEDKFDSVRLQYSDFVPTPYPQLFGDFVPNLSVIDALFNVGEAAGRLLLSRETCPTEAVATRHG